MTVSTSIKLQALLGLLSCDAGGSEALAVHWCGMNRIASGIYQFDEYPCGTEQCTQVCNRLSKVLEDTNITVAPSNRCLMTGVLDGSRRAIYLVGRSVWSERWPVA